MPHDIEPMYATPVKEPFSDPNWLFEIKLDGYRAVAEVDQGAVSLYSRKKISFKRQFAPIVAALQSLGHDAVLDGEVVVLDEQGKSSFQLLQNYQRTGSGNLCYFVFDLLYLDGKNLCDLPLVTRKQTLRTILPERADIRFSDHIPDDGTSFYQIAQANQLEGIVAKKNDSRYLPGKRSREWLKIKITQQQEAIICGFTRPRGSRSYFRSLVLGVYEGDQLTYIGLCGGGFDEPALKEVSALMEPLVQDACPFGKEPPTGAPATWVRPQLVCEVVFAEWTDEQVMRQPVFAGLRQDKDPSRVIRERELEVGEALREAEQEAAAVAAPEKAAAKAADQAPSPAAGPKGDEEPSFANGSPLPVKDGELVVEGHKLRFTNLDKLFWPEEGYTKRDVVEYYRRIAPFILPYLKNRPQSLYRTPQGMAGEGFFQKEAGELPPEWVATREIFSRSNNKNIKFFLCQDAATLVYMANLGCVEINPWLSRVDQLDNPDYVVIDLDPEDIGYEQVVQAALAVREVLTQAGASSFPKTSGSRGMHIYVPLAARYDYETAGRFAELVANLAHRLVPDFTSLVRSPGKRQQKVYFDYLQNRRGQTIAAPYSLRVRPLAPVSTPLRWEEVRSGLDPRAFTIKNVHERLARVGDLFHGVNGPGLDLAAALERLQK
ncbi:DNA ligase D [Geomonas sp. Red875]|uniref:DNA ligase (ATP) n=2 Tax=Geomesophilobacter sediminis TaxID=2798584 RepID=A0A8J7JLL2_9BACT|nr:DNA ligase D [Geomesophilobacter sediminis]